MTHTSTEQPYMPHATLHPAQEECLKLQARVAELHARVQELEASQAQRVPLTDAQIKEGRNAVNDDPDDRPEPWAFREGVKFAERMHGITQEKHHGE